MNIQDLIINEYAECLMFQVIFHILKLK